MSSSLINNYSMCGPPDRPRILMTATVGAKEKGGGREQGNGAEWEEVEWSSVEWSEGASVRASHQQISAADR